MRDQAEILVRMFMQMIEFNMLSKNDFEKHKSEMNLCFEKVNSELEIFKSEVYNRLEKIDERFDTLEESFDYKLNKLSLQLAIKLGIMLALSIGMLSTILAIKL